MELLQTFIKKSNTKSNDWNRIKQFNKFYRFCVACEA